ncbi:MAG: potassium transporter TrkG [Actinomycetaceae bacterium]|nr:potassium transporter TrkG [Actinomycetaceae bacterium]
MLPVSRSGNPLWPTGTPTSAGTPAPLSVALFTATSATCVTGLIVADTATYWSGFGQFVIAGLIEVGGLGTMTFAAILAVYVAHRLKLHQRIAVAHATGSISMEDIRGVVKRIIGYSLVVQLVFAIPLVVDLYLRDHDFSHALTNGLFLSVSAYNNAGFALKTDSLMSYADDPWILLPIAALIIIGGIGFPVLAEITRAIRAGRSRSKRPKFSLTSRIMFVGTAVLILGGWILMAALEWNNEKTLAPYSVADKLMISFFSSVSPRTAGFNAMDIAGQHDVTWLITDILMFIGGGPAGTAGGVKVTTVMVLAFMVLTEVRAGKSVQMFGARIGRSTHRTAITVLVLAYVLVAVATGVLMVITPWGLDKVLFEVISALGTVGLSTGITPYLPISAQIVIGALMFIGRVGPMTIATALAVRPDTRLFELPKERLIIG